MATINSAEKQLIAQSNGCGILEFIIISLVCELQPLALQAFQLLPIVELRVTEEFWLILQRFRHHHQLGCFSYLKACPQHISHVFNPKNTPIFLYFNTSDGKIPGSQCIHLTW